MKKFAVIFLAGVAFVSGGPAFAGRDETQMMQLQKVMKAKQAVQLAQAQKASAGLAGATGAPGKIEPEGQPTKPRRDPSAHP